MSQNEAYSLADYVADLKRITATTPKYSAVFDQVGPLARKLALAKNSWLKPEFYEFDDEKGYSAYLLYEESVHSLAIFAVTWGPHGGTPPHDHGTWVVVAGVEGEELNIKYNRVDDRSRPDYAELEERCVFTANAGDVVCLKPRGIHVVRNDTDHITLSLHTYGRHFDYTERTAFNLKTNEVYPLVVDVR